MREAARISAPTDSRRSRYGNDKLILDILAQSNRPLSAYDIADRVSLCGKRMVPNQAYRTLARLIEQRIVVRIETLNAYSLRRSDANACLICTCCHTIAFVDLPDVRQTLGRAARLSRFGLVDALIEAKGKCEECTEPAPHS